MQSGLYNTDALHKPCPAPFVKVCEGSTAVLFPPALTRRRGGDEAHGEQMTGDDDQAVFYNPAQVVNRDLSVCVLEVFARLRRREPCGRRGRRRQQQYGNDDQGDGLAVLEALSATGLRAIRYYKEVSNVRYVIANDLDADAVACIRRNCEYNDVPLLQPTVRTNAALLQIAMPLQHVNAQVKGEGGAAVGDSVVPCGIIANLDDANDLMHRLAMNPSVHPGQRLCLVQADAGGDATTRTPYTFTPLLQQERMDVVDLDPYGSASPFLNAALACIDDGGLLLVTSTDSAILCGNYPSTCHGKYNSIPYKAAHCHEMAVRTLLAAVERVANKHRRYIEPLLSLHIDFYVRCFLRVYTQPAEVKLSVCKLGHQLQCTHCPAFWLRPLATVRPPRRRSQHTIASTLDTPHDKAHDSSSGVDAHQGKRGRDDDDDKESTTWVSDVMTPGRQTERYPAVPDYRSEARVTCTTLANFPCNESCTVCGSAVALSGPIYAAATHNKTFLHELLAVVDERAEAGRLTAIARVRGLVLAALDELADCPLFYEPQELASYVRVRCPPTPCLVGALARLGYRCSQVHCAANGLKTDCPPDLLMRVMLQWKVEQNAKDGIEDTDPPRAGTGMASRLCVSALAEADLRYDKKYDFRRQVTGLAKFIPNAPGWGPRRRHQGAAPDADINSVTSTARLVLHTSDKAMQ